MDIYAAERQLNSYLDRRAAKVPEDRPGQRAANEEVNRQRAEEQRRTHNIRLINAKAWAAHYNALSLAAHDRAARYAEQRDEARALVRELEAKPNGRKSA